MRSRVEQRRSGRWGSWEQISIVRVKEQCYFEALESRQLLAAVDVKGTEPTAMVFAALAEDGGSGGGQFSDGLPAAQPGGKGPSRIVGGSPSAPGAWPWMASLQEGGHFCGGTLVAADAIVTAAHCVEGASARQLTVVLGRNELNGAGGKSHAVNEILVHPDYNSFTNDSDVAILLLASPSDEKPLPILTPNRSELAAAGALAVIAGWGVESEGNSRPPNALREVTVPIVSNEVANEPQAYAGAITDRMLAAGLAAGGKDSCQGDSGGPLMVADPNGQYYLAGIVSWGDGCARPNKYGIYTRVTSVAGWIDERTRVSPTGSLNFSQDRYATGQTAKLLLKDLDLAGQGSVEIELQADNGDQEQITLLESGPGRFAGTVFLYGGPVSVNDSQLQVTGSHSISARYQDQNDGTGQQVTVSSSARIVVDDHGNQSTTATPLTVPGSVGAEIELTGDVDWFRVEATADKMYAIDVILDGSLNDSVLTLFDESGNVVLDTDDDSGPGFASSLLWRPPMDQVLNVQVAGYGSFVGTYHLQVTANVPTADDHGNSSFTATPISVGSTSAGRIETRNDRDWFRFPAVQGTSYRITSQLLSLGDSVLRLVDSLGVTEFAYNDDFGGGLGSEIIWTAVTSEDLLIEVTGYDESIGRYELILAETTLPIDDHGNLAITASAIAIPSRTAGTINSGQDLDWFAFEAVGNSQYVFSVELSGLSDSILRLLDDDLEEVEYNDDFEFSPASRIAWTAPTSGRFYLEVSAFDEEDAGAYELVTAIASGGADDHGDSADTATELTIGSVSTASIDPIGDRDYFRFAAVAGLYYEIETTAGSLSDTLITLYDADGTTLLLHDDDSGNGFASFLRWQAPATGSYAIAVEGFAQTTGSYDLRVSVPRGDSNLDGVFDSSDLVLVFQRGEYEDEIFGNSAWDDGDWTGDGEFSTADLVAAFQAGGYVTESRRRPAANPQDLP